MGSASFLFQLWPLFVIIAIAVVAQEFLRPRRRQRSEVVVIDESDKNEVDTSVYEKKPYLFDTNSEFTFYKVLIRLFGEQYHVFPQINYSHLIKPKKSSWTEERRSRSRIDRKSADFVLCDKDTVVPRLVIELDGSVHAKSSKRERDDFIDSLANEVGLPILHIRTGRIDEQLLMDSVAAKLRGSSLR